MNEFIRFASHRFLFLFSFSAHKKMNENMHVSHRDAALMFKYSLPLLSTFTPFYSLLQMTVILLLFFSCIRKRTKCCIFTLHNVR